MAKSPKAGSPQSPNPFEIARLGLDAYKEGPPAVLVWAAGAVVALAAVTIPSLLASQQANLAVGTLAFSIVAIGFLCWLASRNDERLLRYRWRVLRQPMQNDKLVRDVNAEMKKVYATACETFEQVLPGVKDQVRTNIFLADFRRAPQGIAFELRMSPQFSRQMLEPTESRLSFQPGQGATGEVFLFGQPVLTTDRLYGVKPEEKPIYDAVIAAKLKAILSLPIADDKNTNVIAVLNVDVCGDALVKYEHLTKVYEAVKGSAAFVTLCALLNQFDKAWLTISLGRA
jgi:hypothetical protein